MKKVVHVAMRHKINDSRIWRKECCSLAADGYDVVYMTSDICGEFESKRMRGGVIVKCYQYYPEAYRIQPNMVKYWRERKKQNDLILKMVLDEKPDILHIHEYHLIFLTWALKRKKKQIKIIYDLHEDTPREIYPSYLRNYGYLIAKAMEKFVEMREKRAFRLADGIIAATPHIGNRINKNKNLQIVCNYPIIEDIPFNMAKYTEPDSEGKYACYSGKISEDRGISEIMSYGSRINGKVYFAGPAVEDYLKLLKEKYLNQEGSNMIYLGNLSPSDVNEMYRRSRVGLCLLQDEPNTYYSLPIKLFEYMAAGIPVVCSNFPTWEKIIKETQAGITVDYKNSEEVIRAINTCLDDDEAAERLGANGRKAVLTKYNWAGEEKKLLTLYKALWKGRD